MSNAKIMRKLEELEGRIIKIEKQINSISKSDVRLREPERYGPIITNPPLDIPDLTPGSCGDPTPPIEITSKGKTDEESE